MLERFFVIGAAPYPWLWQQHDPWLVLLSILIDVGAAIVALHMATLARVARNPRARQLALLSGALSLGAGIWAMHFVAMLAFEVCAQGRLDPWVTAGSVLPSFIASWVALGLLAQPQVNAHTLSLSAILVAVGIGTMHYVGMEAAAVAPIMRYDPIWFVVSLVVAVLLAALALWVRFGLQRYWHHGTGATIALAGVVMGMAITGMHYTGMAAIRFVQPIDSLSLAEPVLQRNVVLPLAIAVITLVLGLLAVAINIGIRYRQLLEAAQQSEARQRAVVDTAVDGIVMINGQGIIQAFNQAAERIFGWTAAEVIGRNVNMLMPEPYRAEHDGYLRRHLMTGHTSIIGVGREVEGVRKDGGRMPMRLAVGRVRASDADEEPLFVGFLIDLTSYKRLEAERRHGAEQLRSLISNLPGVAFRCHASDDWPMVFISEAVEALTGWRADEFLKGQVLFGQLILPEDSERIGHDVQVAMQYGMPYQIEYRIRTRTGSLRWVSEYGRAQAKEQEEGYWLDGVILDITESKARTAEFEGTLAALDRSQAMAEFDLAGRILSVNDNFLQITGYERAELLGQSHAMLCSAEEVASERYQCFWQRLQAGEFQRGEFERRGKQGVPLWIYATYNPIFNASGTVDKIIKLATDLSARRAMEEDLRRAKDSAEQAAAARASFLANMSHEIRTPMNAIIGFSEALLETPLDESQRRHLGTVHHSAQSMLRLLNDILDTAKLEKGAVALEIAPFNLFELCQHVLASLRINADKNAVQLQLDYPDDLARYWLGDAFRIQQILLNLLGNAIKFTHQGQVQLRLQGRTGGLMLIVEDTGIGMDEAAMQRIFDPFAQADASTTRRYGGTGLGTTIAHQLAELMHGDIHVASQPGVGSTFRVRLPLHEADDAQVAALNAPHMTELPPLRILGVDDVPANLELLELALARQGHQLVCAQSGEQALDLCGREHFDVILMDLQMPGMDGLEATRRIRAMEAAARQQDAHSLPRQAVRTGRSLAIIALSANVQEQDRQAALAAGMNGFSGKPLELARLTAEIARVLGLALKPSEVVTAAPLASSAPPLAAPVMAEQATAPAIDWARGLALWQVRAPWQAAITRLLQEAPGCLDEMEQAMRRGQSGELKALAHRLTGAAANLALPGLQTLAARLEALAEAQRQQPDGAVAAWPMEAAHVLLQAIRQEHEAVRQALYAQEMASAATPTRAEAEPKNAATSAAAPSPTALTAAQRDQVHAALQELQQALARGELPSQPLAILEQSLSEEQLHALQAALERFDFVEGQRQLAALASQLSLDCHEGNP